jgi:hypothetical protein
MASERIPQGGGLTVYDPLVAAQGAFRDPGAYYNATLRRPLQGAGESAQKFLGKYAFPTLAIAGAVPAAMQAKEEIEAGRPAGALGALAPGLLSTAGAAMIGRTGQAMIGKGGLAGSAVGLGLMGLGALLPGAAAAGVESARQSATGKPTKGKEAEFSTQLAMRGQLMDQDLSMLDRSLATQLQATYDLTKFYNQAQVDQYKAMAPEIEKAKMNDFARYQNAMALQGRIRGQLGVLQTAGNLAQGQQAGMYGLAATALQNNPYAQIGGIG